MPATNLSPPVNLTEAISLFRPSSSAVDIKTCPVALVVLCTWVGAANKHIEKYIAKYHEMWSGSSILVIQTSLADMTYRSDTALRKSLAVAQDLVCKHRQTLEEGQQIILHAFSNGGAYTATQLSELASSDGGWFDKVIFDSCPGCYVPRQMAHATTAALPQNTWIRAPAMACMYVWSIIYLFVLRTIGQRDTVSVCRERMCDTALFPANVPRLYLYSKADQVVHWEDVHAHAEESLRKGYQTVEETQFLNGAHCNLLAKDAKEYWAAVNAMVKRPFPRSVL